MFGEPGRLYCYLSYGLHVCANVVVSPTGEAAAILLRAGEIVDGLELARSRRPASKEDADLARGPGNLGAALGLSLADNGTDLATGAIRLEPAGEFSPYSSGPRTGVSGPGGGDAFPWRFWIPGEPSVSRYRRHSPKVKAENVI